MSEAAGDEERSLVEFLMGAVKRHHFIPVGMAWGQGAPSLSTSSMPFTTSGTWRLAIPKSWPLSATPALPSPRIRGQSMA